MKKLIALVAMLCSLSACATILLGKTQDIEIDAEYSTYNVKAEVVTDKEREQVILPTMITVPRNTKSITVNVVGNECYDSNSVTIRPLGDWLWLNGVFSMFGVTCTTVDMINGAKWEYADRVTVPLSFKENEECE